jgi:hypothetical protein
VSGGAEWAREFFFISLGQTGFAHTNFYYALHTHARAVDLQSSTVVVG